MVSATPGSLPCTPRLWIATSFPPIATNRHLNTTAPPAGELGGVIGIVAVTGYCAVRSEAIVAKARALRSAPVW